MQFIYQSTTWSSFNSSLLFSPIYNKFMTQRTFNECSEFPGKVDFFSKIGPTNHKHTVLMLWNGLKILLCIIIYTM